MYNLLMNKTAVSSDIFSAIVFHQLRTNQSRSPVEKRQHEIKFTKETSRC